MYNILISFIFTEVCLNTFGYSLNFRGNCGHLITILVSCLYFFKFSSIKINTYMFITTCMFITVPHHLIIIFMSASFFFLHFSKTFQKVQVSHILGDLIPVTGRLDHRGSILPNANLN